MKKIIIINKIVFFTYLNIVFFFNLESKSSLNENADTYRLPISSSRRLVQRERWFNSSDDMLVWS